MRRPDALHGAVEFLITRVPFKWLPNGMPEDADEVDSDPMMHVVRSYLGWLNRQTGSRCKNEHSQLIFLNTHKYSTPQPRSLSSLKRISLIFACFKYSHNAQNQNPKSTPSQPNLQDSTHTGNGLKMDYPTTPARPKPLHDGIC